jgi:uncharacterized protein
MIGPRAALIAALLAASLAAHARSDDATDVAPALRVAVTAYRAGDLVTAETALRALAPGNPDADAWLGAVQLDRGENLEGLRRLQRAADAGSSEGKHRLGLVFAQGLAGMPRNEQRAVALFESAAAAGHRRAQINVGILYMRGQGVARDLVQARAWLEKAAASGDPHALYALGRAMEDSQGLAGTDPVRAADLYRRAAEKGHPGAVLRYALALSDGNGVKRDPVAAQRLLLQAQQNGMPEAALALGDMAARMPASRDKAAHQKIVQTAVGWYEVAAHAGVASAQFKLANAYLAGAGVGPDPAQALLWYGRAAHQGLPEAQHALGFILIGGAAGTVDPIEGYKWLLLAERNGYPDSAAVRQKVDGGISADERRQAEALAQGFIPTNERPIDHAPPRLGTMRP